MGTPQVGMVELQPQLVPLIVRREGGQRPQGGAQALQAQAWHPVSLQSTAPAAAETDHAH